MIFAQVLDLDTQAIDFVLAFPQVELKVPVYMELPAGMDLAGHGKDSSDNDSTKTLSLKAVLSLQCQFIEACFNPYKDRFNFSKYFELSFP